MGQSGSFSKVVGCLKAGKIILQPGIFPAFRLLSTPLNNYFSSWCVKKHLPITAIRILAFTVPFKSMSQEVFSILILTNGGLDFLFFSQGEWKPKQIDNPKYKGEWVHPEIDNPEYQPDDQLYKYDDIGTIGFDLWQVCCNS